MRQRRRPRPDLPSSTPVRTPNRPTARGIAPPPSGEVICQLPRDPSFEEIKARGGTVEKHRDGHTVAGGTVWVSGEIPRVTSFETGLIGGVRFTPNEDGTTGSWSEEMVSFGSGPKSPTAFTNGPGYYGREIRCRRCAWEGACDIQRVK